MEHIREVGKIAVTKEFRFEAAHCLCNSELSAEENKELFHACYHMHGHSYKLFVTVEGGVNPKTGFVIDFKKLKSIVTDNVINLFDHTYINDIELFKKNPQLTATCENMLMYMWGLLARPFKEVGAKLQELKLYETETSHAIYRGETLLINENGEIYSPLTSMK